jgi:prepilin-type N-terminal cleavage/methylation domain-containing protein
MLVANNYMKHLLSKFILEYKKYHTLTAKGFTLVELLVASTIFSFVVIVATGALFSAQELNTRLQQTQIILDGVNLSMETMMRDIRYGYYYHCATAYDEIGSSLRKSCPYDATGIVPGGQALVFHPADALNDSTRVAYFASTTSNGTTAIYKATCGGGTNPCTWQPATEQITADDVNINKLSFFVVGANTAIGDPVVDDSSTSDTLQPFITVIVSGTTKPSGKARPVTFRVQESAVSRIFDN